MTSTPMPAQSEEFGPARPVAGTAYPVAQRLLRPVRPRRPATIDGRLTDRAAVSGAHLAFLANHLTPRDRWLARVVVEHRVFTSTQLTQLAFGSARTANQRLLQLYQWRVLDRFQPLLAIGSAPIHYVLDLAGAAVLAAEDGLDPAEVGYRHDRALGIGHSLRLAHTLGVNGLYAALVTVARHTSTHTATDLDGRGGRAVVAWWPETRCARVWGDLARPDAYARWREDGREAEFFLEYDTGTEPLTRVAGKLHDYARLAAATGITTPVLFWFPTLARESAARAALASTVTALDNPAVVPVATTAADRAHDAGEHASTYIVVPDSPAAARWLPLTPGSATGGAPGSRLGGAAARVRLARLTWPPSSGLDNSGSEAPLDADATAGVPDAPGSGGPVGLAEPEPMPPAGQSAYATRPAPDAVECGRPGDPRARR